jgi:hypothetical protein
MMIPTSRMAAAGTMMMMMMMMSITTAGVARTRRTAGRRSCWRK